MSEIILTMKNITKEFPGVKALDNVNFEARSGEVLVLAGENGAGKSTLMKVLSGVWPYPSYDGEIYVKGELKRFKNTKEADEAKVAIIHQELNLVPDLTVAENIFLGRQPVNILGIIDWNKVIFNAQEILDKLGITDIKPTDIVKELTVGKQQMVGRDIKDMFPIITAKKGNKILEIKNFCVDHPFLVGEKKVKNATFDVYAGEVLGIAGLMGAGRTELVTGIFGGTPKDIKGEIYLNGKQIFINSPKDAIDAGIALITEDRKLFGLFLDKSIEFNSITSSKTLKQLSNKLGVIDEFKGREITQKYFNELNIKAPSIDTLAGNLSGENQQKIIIGKWVATNPKVLILDEPTRGIDVGAKVEIYKLINKLAKEGVAIIMISSELPEVMGMSDRILVMCEGELVADCPRETATKEKVVAYATGNLREVTNK